MDDLIEGIVRFTAMDDNFTGPVNLGNPREFTIRELAETILALSGSRSKIISLPLPFDDPRRRQPDISLATAKLNWTPKVPLEEGLKMTIAYFDRLLSVTTGRDSSIRA